MTSYETFYKAFFDRIEKDKNFFSYNGVSSDDALTIAIFRAKNYLKEAIVLFRLKCDIDTVFVLDDDLEEIDYDFNEIEINIIASLMYERYLSRDISTLKSMTNALTSSEIKLLYAPSNERKTFMDMYKTIKDENLVLIDGYNGRDRETGKRKIIDYDSLGV